MKDLINKVLAWIVVLGGLSICMTLFFFLCCGILDGWWIV